MLIGAGPSKQAPISLFGSLYILTPSYATILAESLHRPANLVQSCFHAHHLYGRACFGVASVHLS